MKTISTLFSILLFLGMLLIQDTLAAESPVDQKEQEKEMAIARAIDELAELEQKIKKAPPEAQVQLKEYSNNISRIRQTGEQCVEETNEKIKLVDRDLKLLDPQKDQKSSEAPAPEGEAAKKDSKQPDIPDSPKIAKKRKALKQQKIQLKEQLVDCSLLMVHGEALDRNLQHHKEVVLARHVLSQEKNVVQIIALLLPSAGETNVLDDLSSDRILENVKGHQIQLLELLSVMAFAFFLGLVLRGNLRKSLVEESEAASEIALSIRACTAKFAPVLLPMLAASLFIGILPIFNQDHTLKYTIYDITWLAVIWLSIRIFLQPCKPAAKVLDSPPQLLHKIGRNLKLLALFLFANWLIPTYVQSGLVSETYGSLTSILISILIVATGVRILSLARNIPGWFFSGYWWWLAAALMLTGMLAILLGYFNLGNLIIRGTILTPVTLMITLMLNKVLMQFMDGLRIGRYGWQQKIRLVIGLNDDDPTPGIGWLRFLGFIILWSLFGITLLHIWDAVETGEGLIRHYIFEGVEIFGIKFIPARILFAIMLLSLLLAVTRWVKSQMKERWLKHAHLDQGAEEALVTTTGYIGGAVSVIAALSVAGLDLKNLAIVAGALSVGIGFGLQNVVNNFVSGLILLVERPVKRGDWIVVNGTEGVVRRISIRSTLLETFDGSDVIVPNSELISGQVTNWMLKNRWGRVRVPIGVAYGSDVQLVTEILLKAANEHEDVVTDRTDIPKPSVVFNEFGADSLNFELRANVKDVNLKKRVLSDLNYAIEAAFREAGIEIPFAQRDLHLDEPVRVELTQKRTDDDPNPSAFWVKKGDIANE